MPITQNSFPVLTLPEHLGSPQVFSGVCVTCVRVCVCARVCVCSCACASVCVCILRHCVSFTREYHGTFALQAQTRSIYDVIVHR